ncbi:hypothetical protein Trihar35433_943 [Trichoderma harzianum]|nr:hypothetical protein Trihar35433_943 [Trichoderma harzianum]
MDRSKYTVGWICALTEEFVAARAFLDEKHERLNDHDPKDSNSYALGKMSNHNIVIACLPLGGYGTVSAAGVAINMIRSFPNIRIGLMVGIGGGAPSEKHDIRLGDVVVSTPGNGNGGVFQYDFGKSIQAKEFVETGFLDQPPEMLRTALQDLKSDYELEGHTLVNDVEKVLQDKPNLKKTYCHPNVDDRLYRSFFVHSNPSEDCQSCGNAYYDIKRRDPRDEDGPVIHYGLIASGNQVMKDARIRDKLAKERGVLCFEMEAAGLMNRFPCLVIRGICDYSDSHKNDKWHGYAAMIAAAYTKDLLRHLIPEQVVVGKSAVDLLEGIHGQLESLVQKTDYFNNKLDLAKLPTAHGAEFDSFATQHDDECLTGTRTEILHLVGEWAASPQGKCIFWLNGMAGTGKSTICRTLAKHFQEKRGLGATFFFKRGEADRGNASKFFPTIAKQIYQKVPGINLRRIIDEQPDIANKALSMQFKKLILQPLSSLHSTGNELPLMTIVIDALDECEDDKDIRAIIQLLPQVQETKCIQLRVFITSRPELPIRLGFKDVKEDYQDLVLHHVPRADIEHDISLFINHKLNSIRKYRSLPHDWPGAIKIQTLVAMSVPLFIFAATVCRMLQDHDLVPEEALEDVFKYKADESKLDAVYLPILNRVHSKYDEHRRQKQFKQVQELVNTIILLENPLSIISLSDLIGYEDSVACVAFSLDTETLASISKDGISKFWDVDTGILQRSIQHDYSMDDAVFSLDISLLATRRSRKITIWDLKLGGTQKYELDKTSGARPSLAFSADGLLLAGVSDKEIIVWDITTGSVGQTIKGQSGKVQSLAFSPNSLLLASGYEDSIVKLWDITTGTQKHCFKARGSVKRLTFSPDSQFLAISHHGGTTLWDLATYSVYKEHSHPANIIAYSPDGKILASTYRNNNTIELWDLDAEFLNQERHSESIEEIEFSSDGKLAISYPRRNIWSPSQTEFSSDGKMTTTYPGTSVSVWDSSQEALQQVLKNGERNPYGRFITAFSVDGRLLACSSRLSWDEPDDFDDAYRQLATAIDIWDIKMGIHWSILMDGGCHSMAFSPNNQQLVTFSWEGISSWVYSGDSTQCPSLTRSNDNAAKVLRQGVENDGCWVLQQRFKQSEKRMDRWTKASSISFSPDGRQLTLCFTYEFKDFYCKVEIWDPATGLLIQTLQQGPGRLKSVAFSMKGQLLAREQRYDENERPKMCVIIEPWDMDTGKLHKDLVKGSKYSYPKTGPPPVEGLEFLKIQNRYVECKDFTVFEKEWVCFQGRKILWLPPGYRATCSSANDMAEDRKSGTEKITSIYTLN